jgi:hypothetical protein
MMMTDASPLRTSKRCTNSGIGCSQALAMPCLRPSKGRFMSPLVLILVVILIVVLLGGGYGYRRGNNVLAGGGGLVGLILIILLILFLMGRL